jgi:TRAP-type C4-dicarboxylate transport system permease small subunit
VKPFSSRFWTAIRWLEAVLGLAAGGVLFAMMALTFVDVVCRYLFNRSVPGSFEIIEIMMALLIFSGLPLVSRRGEHVSVDLIDHFLPVRVRRIQSLVLELLSGVLLLGLAVLLWHKAGQVAEYGDTTTVLLILIAPFVYAMAVFLGLAGAIHLVNCAAPGGPGTDSGAISATDAAL